ncbi:MFS transporter [Halanaeroarchaeum sulfurireducens]|nr:MFS transporter [Halanaeroarchaeum sulfurireducens]
MSSGRDTSDSDRRSTTATVGVILGASLISMGLAAFEIVPASVTPMIRESLQIGPSLAGLIVSIMFGIAVLTSLPAGIVLDRTNSRVAIAAATFVLLIAGGWAWYAGVNGEYWSVILSRAFAGVAYVVVWNAGIDVVSRGVSFSNQATAVSVFTASGPLGFALGQGAGPIVARHFGWPAIFLVFNGITVLGLVIFWPASTGLGRSEGAAPSLQEFRTVIQSRDVWTVGFLGFLSYSLYLFVNTWGSSYLTEEIGLTLAVSGFLVAAFPAVGVISRIGGGFLSDRLFESRRRPILYGSFGLAAPLLLLFTHVRSIPVLAGVLLLSGFAIQLSLGLTFTYVRELVDIRVAATAVAFQTSIGLTGAFLSPIAGGVVVEKAGFGTAFFLAGVLAIVGILVTKSAQEPTRL